MSFRERLVDLIERRRGKTVAIQERTNGRFYYSQILSAYENLFAQLRPLINEMKGVLPYGVSAKGVELPLHRTPELEVLQDPNDQMGLDAFLDLAFAIWLTESELNIRVHFDKKNEIVGYTILPVGSRLSYLDHYEDKFQVYNADGSIETLTSAEVMTLRFSRSPRNIDKGVSPASSVFIWTQVDDLMAQFQRGFFENGAVPATVTTIRASTHAKYMEVRDDLEKSFKGADNKNKTLYLWRQQLDNGETADQVEVKPIQGHNSTMALRELYEIICDKLNKSVGVSNFILGDDSSAKYDNAELSDYIFTKRRVAPALRAFWSGFQHELDRIYAEHGMNGLGYAIELNIELPELTDRRKTQAETAKINAETLVMLVQNGATPKKAVEALGLSDEWRAVANGVKKGVPTVPAVPPKSEAPTDSIKALPCGCGHHHDDIKEPEVSVELTGGEKDIYDILMRCAKQIAEEDPTYDMEKAKAEINEILKAYSEKGAEEGAKILRMFAIGQEAEEYLNSEYVMSDEFTRATDERLDEVLSNYESDIRETVKEVLETSKAENWTKHQLQKELREALPSWRAALIAQEETHTSLQVGRYDLDKQLANKYDLEITLVYDAHIDGTTCDLCKSMHGQEVPLGEAFPDHTILKDGTEVAIDHTMYNLNGCIPSLHPRCRCTFNEKVRRKS